MKKTISFLLGALVCWSSFAARTYTETGSMSCTAAQQTAETVVLFVNGIDNSLDDAEANRLGIQQLVVPDCPTCTFKKLYNQADGLYDDVNELNLVGAWQMKAIDKASVAQYDRLIRDVTALFADLARLGMRNYGDANRAYLLDDLKTELVNWLKIERQLAKDGYQGVAFRYYDPLADGSSYAAALAKRNAKAKENSETLFGGRTLRSTALEIYNLYLDSNAARIDHDFSVSYRALVTAAYFSDRNLYLGDAVAAGAMTKSVESLTTLLTEYVLSGRKVVLVPHSQGNHVVDLAYSALAQARPATFMATIRVVGVASVSSVSPSNTYITWDEDHTVLTEHTAGGNRPLAANFLDATPWYGYWADTLKDHSFVKIYLSSNLKGKYSLPSNAVAMEQFAATLKDASSVQVARDVVKQLVLGSVKAAVPVLATIETNSLLTAQLRWEDYDDMDLHITEPDGHVAYYRQPTGTHGYLDLDDTDGLGPEHYYQTGSWTCDQMAGKTWRFAVHQFPSGGAKAAVHFMIKVGDTMFLSRSFGLAQWPATNLDIGSVSFQKSGDRLTFEIKVVDPNGNDS